MVIHGLKVGCLIKTLFNDTADPNLTGFHQKTTSPAWQYPEAENKISPVLQHGPALTCLNGQ